jgi:hypothetical protein
VIDTLYVSMRGLFNAVDLKRGGCVFGKNAPGGSGNHSPIIHSKQISLLTAFSEGEQMK